MMTIGGFAGLLRKSADIPEKNWEYLDIIREEVQKLEGVVTAVVEYASITSADKHSLTLSDLLHLALHKLEKHPLMQQKTPEVSIQCPVCRMQGDMEMLARALEELVANALEASHAGTPQVALRVKQEKKMVRIQVEDQGEGVKKEFMPYIYDPFFTTRADKVGMGLCLAKRIALEQQGGLTLHSEKGEGAVAELTLPIA